MRADNSQLTSHRRDDGYLIHLFTVGGRPVNLDPDHKVKILVNHGYSEERRYPYMRCLQSQRACHGGYTGK